MTKLKKFMATAMLAVGAFALVIGDADARRMGGGGNFGRQSHNVSRQAAPPSNNYNTQRPAPPAAAPAPAGVQPRQPSRWGGIAGGLLGGLALGALFSHLGMGGLAGGMGGMLMSLLTIALVVMAAMALIRMFRGNKGPQPMPAGGYNSGFPQGGFPQQNQPYARNDEPAYAPEIGSRVGQTAGNASGFQSQATGSAAAPWGVPAGFDAQSFLRNAKTYFIRLQAAWDKADIDDIREFTTPEMFAEIRMQLQERGASPNNTDVVQIDADLMGVETMGNEYMASVKFSGMIREARDALAEPFHEVWNLTKPVSGGGWVLAGIQQLN
jgi:predicted lipid-binding transport protein (Tim44 family)